MKITVRNLSIHDQYKLPIRKTQTPLPYNLQNVNNIITDLNDIPVCVSPWILKTFWALEDLDHVINIYYFEVKVLDKKVYLSEDFEPFTIKLETKKNYLPSKLN